MRVALIGVLAFVLGCGRKPDPVPVAKTPAPAEQPAEKSDPALVGKWRVTGITAAGKPVPADGVKALNLGYKFDGKRMTTSRPDRKENQSDYTLDPTAEPKRITMTMDGTPVNAIYRVTDTQLELCMNVDGGPAPTTFESTASPKTDLLTLEQAN